MNNKSRSGQAILEYVLLLSIILTMSGLLISGVKSSRDKLWKQIICKVSAPCPSCKSPDSAGKILPKAGSCL